MPTPEPNRQRIDSPKSELPDSLRVKDRVSFSAGDVIQVTGTTLRPNGAPGALEEIEFSIRDTGGSPLFQYTIRPKNSDISSPLNNEASEKLLTLTADLSNHESQPITDEAAHAEKRWSLISDIYRTARTSPCIVDPKRGIGVPRLTKPLNEFPPELAENLLSSGLYLIPPDRAIDQLTGLNPTVDLFRRESLERLQRRSAENGFSVVFIDFKNMGAASRAGFRDEVDQILKELPEAAASTFETVLEGLKRHGGDEFLLVLPNTPKTEEHIGDFISKIKALTKKYLNPNENLENWKKALREVRIKETIKTLEKEHEARSGSKVDPSGVFEDYSEKVLGGYSRDNTHVQVVDELTQRAADRALLDSEKRLNRLTTIAAYIDDFNKHLSDAAGTENPAETLIKQYIGDSNTAGQYIDQLRDSYWRADKKDLDSFVAADLLVKQVISEAGPEAEELSKKLEEIKADSWGKNQYFYEIASLLSSTLGPMIDKAKEKVDQEWESLIEQEKDKVMGLSISQITVDGPINTVYSMRQTLGAAIVLSEKKLQKSNPNPIVSTYLPIDVRRALQDQYGIDAGRDFLHPIESTLEQAQDYKDALEELNTEANSPNRRRELIKTLCELSAGDHRDTSGPLTTPTLRLSNAANLYLRDVLGSTTSSLEFLYLDHPEYGAYNEEKVGGERVANDIFGNSCREIAAATDADIVLSHGGGGILVGKKSFNRSKRLGEALKKANSHIWGKLWSKNTPEGAQAWFSVYRAGRLAKKRAINQGQSDRRSKTRINFEAVFTLNTLPDGSTKINIPIKADDRILDVAKRYHLAIQKLREERRQSL